jgi:hypothetical protein
MELFVLSLVETISLQECESFAYMRNNLRGNIMKYFLLHTKDFYVGMLRNDIKSEWRKVLFALLHFCKDKISRFSRFELNADLFL